MTTTPVSIACEDKPPSNRSEKNRRFQQLKNLQKTWQAPAGTIDSGFNLLNKQLPGAGWPRGCLIEILQPQPGGEWLLFTPLLKKLSLQQEHIAWISPPHIPYAPALQQRGILCAQQLLVQANNDRDAFWSMEQLLRSNRCGAALCWASPVTPHSLRRLQLAAETGNSVALLFRPLAAARQASPAALRLQLTPTRQGLTIKLLKIRGGSQGAEITIHTAHSDSFHHD